MAIRHGNPLSVAAAPRAFEALRAIPDLRTLSSGEPGEVITLWHATSESEAAEWIKHATSLWAFLKAQRDATLSIEHMTHIIFTFYQAGRAGVPLVRTASSSSSQGQGNNSPQMPTGNGSWHLGQ